MARELCISNNNNSHCLCSGDKREREREREREKDKNIQVFSVLDWITEMLIRFTVFFFLFSLSRFLSKFVQTTKNFSFQSTLNEAKATKKWQQKFWIGLVVKETEQSGQFFFICFRFPLFGFYFSRFFLYEMRSSRATRKKRESKKKKCLNFSSQKPKCNFLSYFDTKLSFQKFFFLFCCSKFFFLLSSWLEITERNCVHGHENHLFQFVY